MGDALEPGVVCKVTCFSLLRALSVQQSDSVPLVVKKKQPTVPVVGNMGLLDAAYCLDYVLSDFSNTVYYILCRISCAHFSPSASDLRYS